MRVSTVARALSIPLALAACVGPVPPGTSAAVPTELPRLEARSLRPVRDQGAFALEMLKDWHYRLRVPPDSFGQPWPTDAEAVAASIAWIVDHFGALPADTGLRPTAIDHSATAGPEALAPEDRGHTIVLEQQWRGIATDRGAIAYVRGRTIEMVNLDLAALTSVAGTTRAVISRDAALAAVRASFPDLKLSAEDEASMHLAFVWDHEHNRDMVFQPGEPHVLSAQWAFLDSSGRRSPCMVDAHTGRVWIDD